MPGGRRVIVAAGVIATVVLLAAPLHAGTIRADRLDSQYTGLAGQTAYASVGEFQWVESGSEYLASGVLINSQWVLTAAHVVSGITPGNIGTMTFTLGGSTYHVTETHYNSGWTGQVNIGNDIGLVRLDSPVGNVAPAYLYTGSDEYHKITTIVGFGRTGTGLTGAILAAGTKRAGNNVLSLGSALNSIPWSGGGNDNMIVADFDQPGATGDPTVDLAVPTDLEYCAASGDSGGGWFIQINGNDYLAGVTSFLSHNPANFQDAMYGDICGATRVGSYPDWVGLYTTYLVPVTGDTNSDGVVGTGDLAIMASNWLRSVTSGQAAGDFNLDGAVGTGDLAVMAGNWGYGIAGGPVPEPGTLSLMGLGLAVVLARRGRSR